MLGKTLESPLDSKEIKPVNPKWNQHWIFIGRTDAEAETSILWPPDVKSQLVGKDPDSMKDWGQEEKGTTEDEMVGWHHRLHGREFGWTPGAGDGQGGLACCDSWGLEEWTRLSDWTELKGLSYCVWRWHGACQSTVISTLRQVSISTNLTLSNVACLVWSESLQPQGLQPTRILCPWNFPGKNIRVDCHFLLQGIFPTQRSNSGLLYLLDWQADSLLLTPRPPPREAELCN